MYNEHKEIEMVTRKIPEKKLYNTGDPKERKAMKRAFREIIRNIPKPVEDKK